MKTKLAWLAVFCAGISIGVLVTRDGEESVRLISTSQAQTTGEQPSNATAEHSPVGTVPDRDTYFPGTEPLDPDEMRITALGTGQPSVRPKQAAACFLVELGNGDKFLFDIGSGSHERIAAQKIPYDYIDKVFISHLHVDHFGDLASFWLGLDQARPDRPLGSNSRTSMRA